MDGFKPFHRHCGRDLCPARRWKRHADPPGRIATAVAGRCPLAEDIGTDPDWMALLGRHGDAVLDLPAITTRRERAHGQRPVVGGCGATGRCRVRGECGFFRGAGRAEHSGRGRATRADACAHPTQRRWQSSWDSAVARLIRSGHRHPDILGEHAGSGECLLAADSRLEFERLTTRLAVMTAAAQGSEGIRQLQVELQQGMRIKD